MAPFLENVVVALPLMLRARRWYIYLYALIRNTFATDLGENHQIEPSRAPVV